MEKINEKLVYYKILTVFLIMIEIYLIVSYIISNNIGFIIISVVSGAFVFLIYNLILYLKKPLKNDLPTKREYYLLSFASFIPFTKFFTLAAILAEIELIEVFGELQEELTKLGRIKKEGG